MAKYHINKKGEPGQCHAEKNCPFGDFNKDHFDSPEAARAAYEERQQGAFGSSESEEDHHPNSNWFINAAGAPERVWSEEERKEIQEQINEAYEKIKGLALGPGGNAALDKLNQARDPHRTTYPFGRTDFRVGEAMKALSAARSRIGNHNPAANDELKKIQGRIKELEGKFQLPRKNTQVEYKQYDKITKKTYVRSGKFVGTEKEKMSPQFRKNWKISHKTWGLVENEQGQVERVHLGNIAGTLPES